MGIHTAWSRHHYTNDHVSKLESVKKYLRWN